MMKFGGKFIKWQKSVSEIREKNKTFFFYFFVDRYVRTYPRREISPDFLFLDNFLFTYDFREYRLLLVGRLFRS